MEKTTPMQRIIESQNYSNNFGVQVRHALNDPYTSMHRQEQRTGSQASAARDYGVMYERERTKAYDRLFAQYLEEIRAWTWDNAIAECIANVENDPDGMDEDSRIGRSFIGSIIGTFPSGKIYAAWTSNQTDYDVLRDEAFHEALETVAGEHGGWIDNGEGSSDDLFFCMSFDPETDLEEE